MCRVIISGGGTGGHVYPAIAIADALKAQEPGVEILFVGAEGRMEMEKVPAAGYEIEGLPIAGFQRKLTLKNLSFPIKLFKSMRKAKSILTRFQPHIAVGVGGYASGPVLRAATGRGIKTVIQEQNSYPGVTNKILGAKASRICVAYEGMEKFFPKEKIRLTGNPVRQDIRDLAHKRGEAIGYFQLESSRKTIVVMGGSLGAGTLNAAMASATGLIDANNDIQWVWQCGKYYHDQYADSATASLSNVRFMPFIEQVDKAYACADLVICRAGALTISEICVAGKPAILVPSPNVAEDHQTKNAMALKQVDAAVLIKDNEASDKLIAVAIELLKDTDRLARLSHNALAISKPDAAREIAAEILNLIYLTNENKPSA